MNPSGTVTSRPCFQSDARRSTEYNLFSTDAALQEAVRREGAGACRPELTGAGAALGTPANFEHARLANRYPPVLHKLQCSRRAHRLRSNFIHPGMH